MTAAEQLVVELLAAADRLDKISVPASPAVVTAGKANLWDRFVARARDLDAAAPATGPAVTHVAALGGAPIHVYRTNDGECLVCHVKIADLPIGALVAWIRDEVGS